MGREQFIQSVLGGTGTGASLEGADAAGAVQVLCEVGAGRGAGLAAAHTGSRGGLCGGVEGAWQVEGGGWAGEGGEGGGFSAAAREEAEGLAWEAGDFDRGGVVV